MSTPCDYHYIGDSPMPLKTQKFAPLIGVQHSRVRIYQGSISLLMDI